MASPEASVQRTTTIVDVGTGLAVLVRSPGFTLVYDGGSNDDLARGPDNRFLAPTLDSKSLSECWQKSFKSFGRSYN